MINYQAEEGVRRTRREDIRSYTHMRFAAISRLIGGKGTKEKEEALCFVASTKNERFSSPKFD
jgi:hypothetical protein